MKVKWREIFFVKALAFTAAVAAFAATATMGWYQLANFDYLWLDAGPTGCIEVRELIFSEEDAVEYLLMLYGAERAGSALDAFQLQRESELEERLDPSNTNLRWQLTDRNGVVRAGNSRESAPYQTYLISFPYEDSNRVWSDYGGTMILSLWVDPDVPVYDDYRAAVKSVEDWRTDREDLVVMTAGCAGAFLLLSAFLCLGAGHRRGVEGISLNWFHRLPGDAVLAGFLLLLVADGAGLYEVVPTRYGGMPMEVRTLGVVLLTASCGALCLGLLVTFAARCKAGTLFQNTLVWWVCVRLRRLWKRGMKVWRRVLASVPLIWKALVGCGCYGLLTAWTIVRCASWRRLDGAVLLWVAVSAGAALYLLTWAAQWKRIRQGTEEIIGGNTGYQIDTAYMLPDLRAHAGELNNLNHAISAAVEDRMKSERFKAELITNVSHDLKTPLTSIINYVDLLKKEKIDNPRAAEYIEVLDRKSQRLKKLTEDLVEASKASTGNLAVELERLDLRQLVDQALAECGERLAGQGLTVVPLLPDHEVWVEADGRHLWRVLDNLLTNCAKYALEGTRVYVELRTYGGQAILAVKNISRDRLELPAERLLERFIRGDSSRGTVSGSGLGLSIAQSLTELQHGRFELNIDGDLFKTVVTLPLIEPETAEQ